MNINSKKILKQRIIMLFFVLSSCISYSQNDINKQSILGTYVQQDNSQIKLIFDTNSFVLIDKNTGIEHNDYFYHLDTISFGNWDLYEKGFITLSTPKKFTGLIQMNVTEKNVSGDSIYFRLENPIETFYKRTGNKRKISYEILLPNGNYGYLLDLPGIYDSNIFALPKQKGSKISDFAIIVYIDGNIRLEHLEMKNIYTGIYNVKNEKSNYFEIQMPELNYQFLSLRRLNQDYIKVINPRKLLWDGKFYNKVNQN